MCASQCDRSEIHSLKSEQGAFTLRRLASLSGVIRDVAAPEAGGAVYAASGDALYRIAPENAGRPQRFALGEPASGVAVEGDRVFVSAGMDHVYALDSRSGQQKAVARVELGPGPLLTKGGKLYAVNCLSNSVTVLDCDGLDEDVSVMLGVFLGKMYYHNRRIVVNNLFRYNVMVLNPESYIIEEIVRAGGSISYDSLAQAYAVFDDSMVTRLSEPVSAVSLNTYLDLPYGVRVFDRADEDLYLIADQNRCVGRADLATNMLRGQIPLPSQPLALMRGHGESAMALTPYEYCVFSRLAEMWVWTIHSACGPPGSIRRGWQPTDSPGGADRC